MEDERAVRKSTCKLIEKVAKNIAGMKNLSVSCAKVFFHRVCMSQSVAPTKGQHPKLLGVTCLFLACKTEENGRPFREFIWSMNLIDVDEKGKNLYPYGTTDSKQFKNGRPREKWMVEEDSKMFQKVLDNMRAAEILIMQVTNEVCACVCEILEVR